MTLARRASAAAWRAVAFVADEVAERTAPTLASGWCFALHIVALHRVRVLRRS